MSQTTTPTMTLVRDEKAWEVEIKGSIPGESLTEHRLHVIKEIQKDAKLDGFRPGKAPEEAIVRAVGEAEIVRRTIEHTIQHELPEMIAREKVNIVSAPRVTVESSPKSLPTSEPIVFTARAPMAPEIILPDYKDIAKKHNKKDIVVEVTDDEHAATMTHLKRERARVTKVELGVTPQEAAEQAQSMEEKDLPDLDDEFVKSLGYESLEKFTDTVRSNIKTEKEMREIEKRRAGLLDELIEKSKVSYPSILLEYELDEMESRLQQDLDQMRVTMERYLTETKKTRESLREEWKPAADKRAKMRLILSHIALTEKIEADPVRFEKEFANAKKHYPQADDHGLSAHITHALRNESVIAFLENQK